jgi:Zn finger protein HypA/HybF involved in hydrogenase expression
MSRKCIGSKCEKKYIERKTKCSVCSKVFTDKYAGVECELCGDSPL